MCRDPHEGITALRARALDLTGLLSAHYPDLIEGLRVDGGLSGDPEKLQRAYSVLEGIFERSRTAMRVAAFEEGVDSATQLIGIALWEATVSAFLVGLWLGQLQFGRVRSIQDSR